MQENQNTGYSELKDKKIFCPYRDALKAACEASSSAAWEKVYVFQHFSMNRFSIDLADFVKSGKKEKALLEANLHELGLLHKKEIFGIQFQIFVSGFWAASSLAELSAVLPAAASEAVAVSPVWAA